MTTMNYSAAGLTSGDRDVINSADRRFAAAAVADHTADQSMSSGGSGTGLDGLLLTLTTPAALVVRDEMLARVEIAVQASIFVLAVAGNGLVLVLLGTMSRRKELGRMYTMIGHLSCADMFVAMFNLLPQLIWDVTYRFRGGRALCKLVKYAQVAVLYASSFVLVATAVDRYAAICHPMLSHAWTSAAARRLVAVAWTAALVLAVPQLIIFDQVELSPGVHDCWAHFDPLWTLQLYITWFAAAVYAVPLAFLGVVYARICAVVWRSAAVASSVTPPLAPPPSRMPSSTVPPAARGDDAMMLVDMGSSSRAPGEVRSMQTPGPAGAAGQSSSASAAAAAVQQGMSKAKAKTVKLTLTVVVSYAVCWGPFFVAQLWSAWDPQAPFEGRAMVITLLLASLNSCTNPWIYMAFSDHLRRRLRRFCCCCARCRRRQQRQQWRRRSGSSGTVERWRGGGARVSGDGGGIQFGRPVVAAASGGASLTTTSTSASTPVPTWNSHLLPQPPEGATCPAAATTTKSERTP